MTASRATSAMSNNSNILHMKKILGHSRQSSAPEFSNKIYSDNLMQRSVANNGLVHEQQSATANSLTTSLPAASSITKRSETVGLGSDGENELNSELKLDKESLRQLERKNECRNAETIYRRGSLPLESRTVKGTPNPLDSLTREELIEKLKRVESELAKTKKSPTDALNSKDDPMSYEQFDCLWDGCNKTFVVLEVLISHIGQEHIGSGKPSYKCEWHECPRNQKPFTKRHKMYNHMRTHTGERPFQCLIQDCGKRFSRPDSLATHVKTHSNVRPYLCPIPGCGKAYYHSRSLRKHAKAHEMPQDYTQDYRNEFSQKMTYYDTQPFFNPNNPNLPPHYNPEPLFFGTLKPTDTGLGSNHPSAEFLSRSELSGSSSIMGSYSVTNTQLQQMQGMIEPHMAEGHSFSEVSTIEYRSPSNITGALVSDTMINPQSYPLAASLQSQLVFVNPSAQPMIPTANRQ